MFILVNHYSKVNSETLIVLFLKDGEDVPFVGSQQLLVSG